MNAASDKLEGLVELSADDLAAVGGATNHRRRLPIDRNIPPAPPFPGSMASYYPGYGSSPSMFYSPYGYQSSPSSFLGGGLNHSYMAIRRF